MTSSGRIQEYELPGNPSYSLDNFSEMNDSLSERLSAESFNDLFRKACQECESNLQSTSDINLGSLSEALEVLQGFVISQSSSLSTEKIKLVLDLLFVACTKVNSINILKQVCLFLNKWITNDAVFLLLNSPPLEKCVTDFGKQIYCIGDYEIQASLLETLIRICGAKYREYWSDKWFSTEEAKNYFLHINPIIFEVECRNFLNFLNKSELGSEVFSFIACMVRLGPFELQKPSGTDFWIDFNYGTKCLSFYCMDPFVNEDSSLEKISVALWETFVINSDLLNSCTLIVNSIHKSQELILNLNSSYFDYLNSGSVSSSKNDGHQIRLTFWKFYDIHPHLKNIFGDLYEGRRYTFAKCVNKKSAYVSVEACDVGSSIVSKEVRPPVIHKVFAETEVSDKSSQEVLTPSEEYMLDKTKSQSCAKDQDVSRKRVGRKASISRIYFHSAASEDFCANTENSIRDVNNSFQVASGQHEDIVQIKETQRSSQHEKEEYRKLICSNKNVQEAESQSGSSTMALTPNIEEPESQYGSSAMALTPNIENHSSNIIEEASDFQPNFIKNNSSVDVEDEISGVPVISEEAATNSNSVFHQENVKEFDSCVVDGKTVSPEVKKVLKNDLTKATECDGYEINLISDDECLKCDKETSLDKNSSHISLAEEIDLASHFIKETEEKANKEESTKVFDDDSTMNRDSLLTESTKQHRKQTVKRLRLFKSEIAPVLAISPEEAPPVKEPLVSGEITPLKEDKTNSLQISRKRGKAGRKRKSKVPLVQKSKKDSAVQTKDASFLSREMESPKSDSGLKKDTEFPDVGEYSREVAHTPVSSTEGQTEKKSAAALVEDSGVVTYMTDTTVIEKTRFVTIEKSTVHKEVSGKCKIDVVEDEIPKRTTKSGRKAAKRSMEKTQKMLTSRNSVSSYSNRDSDFTYVISENPQSRPLIEPEQKTHSIFSFTDGGTNSEVSWYNRKRKSYLVKTPPKNYSRTKSYEKKRKTSRKSSTSKVQQKKPTQEALLQEDLNKITSSDWSSIEKFQLVTEKKSRSNFRKPNTKKAALHISSPVHLPDENLQHTDDKSHASHLMMPSVKAPKLISSPSSITGSYSTLKHVKNQRRRRSTIESEFPMEKTTILSSLEKDITEPPITKKHVPRDQNCGNFDNASSYMPANEPCHFNDPHDRGHSDTGIYEENVPEEVLTTDMLDGKADHLKRFLKDISMSQSYEGKYVDSDESVKPVRGSPAPVNLTPGCSFWEKDDDEDFHPKRRRVNSGDNHPYTEMRRMCSSKDDLAQWPENHRHERKLQEVEQFAASVREILNKCKSRSNSSDRGFTSSSTADDFTVYTQKNIIPLEFFSETKTLAKKLVCSLQRFNFEFFEKLISFRRKLFYSITSSVYDARELHLAKDIVEYSKCSSSVRSNLQKRLKKLKEAINFYIEVEQEFDRSLMRLQIRACQSYERKFRRISKKNFVSQLTKLVAELKNQLQKLTCKLQNQGFL